MLVAHGRATDSDTTAILTAMANVNNTEPTASCRVEGGN
jgi:hypothetical protein